MDFNKWRKYETAEKLRETVEAYFDSISYVAKVLDDRGVPIRNLRGEEVEQLKYAIPPTQEGLCMYLGISRVTWNKYKTQEWAKEICERADLRIQAWRVEETSVRDKTNGLQFLLANYSNLFERRMELELGERATGALSMNERRKVLELMRENYEADGTD